MTVNDPPRTVDERVGGRRIPARHDRFAVRLRADGTRAEPASAAFTMRVEPAAIDAFVVALRAMSAVLGSQAALVCYA